MTENLIRFGDREYRVGQDTVPYDSAELDSDPDFDSDIDEINPDTQKPPLMAEFSCHQFTDSIDLFYGWFSVLAFTTLSLCAFLSTHMNLRHSPLTLTPAKRDLRPALGTSRCLIAGEDRVCVRNQQSMMSIRSGLILRCGPFPDFGLFPVTFRVRLLIHSILIGISILMIRQRLPQGAVETTGITRNLLFFDI